MTHERQFVLPLFRNDPVAYAKLIEHSIRSKAQAAAIVARAERSIQARASWPCRFCGQVNTASAWTCGHCRRDRRRRSRPSLTWWAPPLRGMCE